MLPCIAEFLVFQSHELEHEMNKCIVNIKKCLFLLFIFDICKIQIFNVHYKIKNK